MPACPPWPLPSESHGTDENTPYLGLQKSPVDNFRCAETTLSHQGSFLFLTDTLQLVILHPSVFFFFFIKKKGTKHQVFSLCTRATG